MASTKIRVVCVSDTHNHRPGEGFTLPAGDILIHAGDLTNQGTSDEVKKALDWISAADYAVKIVVAGNHDKSLDPELSRPAGDGNSVGVDHFQKLVEADARIHYLRHTDAVVHLPEKNVSLRVFGSPYSPSRGQHAWAFQYEDVAAEAVWEAVPEGVDVVVTHTPPAGCCDASAHWRQGGCEALRSRMATIRPLLHVCGHCHEGRGAAVVDWADGGSVWQWQDPAIGARKQSLLDITGGRRSVTQEALAAGRQTAVVNASIMAHSHSQGRRKAFHKPLVVDLLIKQQGSGSGG